MHRFHTIIPLFFFLVIFNLPASQSLDSWIYPSPASSVFPVFNYIDTMNASWTTTVPEPHFLLVWCHPQESSKDYYRLGKPIHIPLLSKIGLQPRILYLFYVVYNKTLTSGHNSQEVVFNFEDRAWELCHFELGSTINSSGEYEYWLNSPNFRIAKTDASEPITWGEEVPGVESTSQIKAIPTSGLAENKVSASDKSAFTPFTSSPSSLQSSTTPGYPIPSSTPSLSTASAPPPHSLPPFASSSPTDSSAPLIPIASPKLPPSSDHSAFPSSHTLSQTAQALIGVGIVVCLSLVLAIISMFCRNQKRQSHQQQQQHQGLSEPLSGGKAQQKINNKQKQKMTKRHRYPLIELAGEEVANELEGNRPVCGIEGKEREREILLHSPAKCQMVGGMVHVYPYNLYTSLTLDPSG